jgi:ribosome biogenesis protein Nip4
MRDLNIFRLINKIEKSIINDSLLEISLEIVSFFKKNDYKFYVSVSDEQAENKFPLIYLVSYDKSKILEERLKFENIHSAGIYFGFIKKGILHISLEGAEFMRNHQILPDSNKITINEKGEKSILYGNDILKSAITNIPSNLKKNSLLAVINQNNEIIAIARAEIDYSSFHDLKLNQKIARNLVDRGYYLRKKQ